MRGNHSQPRRALRCAYTLIELLVVITIGLVLVGLLLTAVQRARATSDRARCLNNLKQLAVASQHHHDVQGTFPTGVGFSQTPSGGTTWETELLSYLEQEKLQWNVKFTDYDQNIAKGKDSPMAQVLNFLLCPSDPLRDLLLDCHACPGSYFAAGSYGGNAGTRPCFNDYDRGNGIFFWQSAVRLRDVSDGPSNTLLLGERSHRDDEFDRTTKGSDSYPLAGWGKWANFCYPAHHLLSTSVPINQQMPVAPTHTQTEIENRVVTFGSGHSGGANFAFVDGSVRFLTNQVALPILQALSTRAGGETVDAP